LNPNSIAMKNLFRITFSAILIISITSFQTKNFQSGESILTQTPIADNFYAMGGTVTINAPVLGDLVVAGGTLFINDTIHHDILAAGGTLHLNGVVGEDLRCVGGQIHINKDVMGDVIVAGGQVTIGENSIVHGRLLASGGTVKIEGNVMGPVSIAAGEFVHNGTLNDELNAKCGEITINGSVAGISTLVADDIKIGNKASFLGDIRYWDKEGDLDFGNSLEGVNATFDPNLAIDGEDWKILGFSTLFGIFWYLGAVLVMMLLLGYFFRNIFKKAASTGMDDPGKSIGFGFLFVFGIPVLVMIAFLSLIGIPAGLILLGFYLAVVFFAATISSLLIANWIQWKNEYQWPFWKLILVSFGIFICLKLISLIPFLGWLAMLAVALICFGAIMKSFWTQELFLKSTY